MYEISKADLENGDFSPAVVAKVKEILVTYAACRIYHTGSHPNDIKVVPDTKKSFYEQANSHYGLVKADEFR